MTEPLTRITQLETRLERERHARRQAEIIAERGMRDLWEVNNELHERVAERVAQSERTLASIQATTHAWSEELRSAVSEIAAHDSSGDVAHEAVARLHVLAHIVEGFDQRTQLTAAPVAVADELLERWQRIAARSGQLLSFDVDAASAAVEARWDTVMAVFNVVIAAIVRSGAGGSINASMYYDHDVVLEVNAPSGFAPTPVEQALIVSVVGRLAGNAGGVVVSDVRDLTQVTVKVPRGT